MNKKKDRLTIALHKKMKNYINCSSSCLQRFFLKSVLYTPLQIKEALKKLILFLMQKLIIC